MSNISLTRPIKKGTRGIAFGWQVDSLQEQVELLAQIVAKRPRIAAGLFPVWVTQSGGSAGNSTTQCTFTYNVFTDSAKTIQIGTTLALVKSRLLNCAMTAGTQGLAYYHPETGVLTLWDVNERAQQTNCT